MRRKDSTDFRTSDRLSDKTHCQPTPSVCPCRRAGNWPRGHAIPPTQPPRKRLSLLRGEPCEEVVWTGDLAYWLAGRKGSAVWRSDWDTEEGYLRLHRELGLMPYVYYEKFWAAEPRYDRSVEVDVRTEGHATLRVWRTPVGFSWGIL